jgi:hypothetical protein
MLTRLAIAAVLTGATVAVHAGNQPPIKSACEADIKAYCTDVTGGRHAIAECLKKHRDQVSDSCKNAIQARRGTCNADIQTYCSDVERGDGRVVACLQQHEDKVSAECKQVLNERSRHDRK